MKQNTYKQLTEDEREKLFDYQQLGLPLRKMADKLKRNISTLSRELNRNRYKKLDVYLPDTAGRKAAQRKANGRKKNLRQYLPRSHRIRRKKHGRKHHKGKILNRIDISKRPKAVEKREEFGHWEGDSLMYRGHSQVLATHTERKSRYLLLGRPEDRTATARRVTMVSLFKNLPEEARRSMTFDNGLEFAEHESFSKKVDIDVYFAQPYAPWQRGTNEHINEIVRRYLPRTADIRRLRRTTIRRVQDMINDRPMKCLGFDTPKETLMRESCMQKIKKAA
ncbi:MAG: hypothetical protein A2487_00695 [Candidatus Raymondbacteria bacterium RifOxyC12_full_50_8]|uniref:Integrase catalytic domain-containing protein n=1 Tax=Candidatus Raymondbacteria bacterium RIFOXYD12_FULL_49_13 TaxID=1817890 RepID=A0A1F7F9H6_UNCRA|nr:MAG: hypothetical protein A2350_03390 [Candidatus Raymondbacteria bacterium RifOxyB12_full_50_8]OGJ93246.1 MAG: hypothetical protein A2248_17915 [Candidatus Raymondbacteria bacterium RIFOXYA2_FULL_49_16]OGJ98152.1 MAG: hypothetical protein A2487_00695 [Candidatus Raymondbacteria bacterium RifOxyC12_full_50_8]OGK03329.1 MAG: hypothetical protein A2519_15260 [Candidatus Raymondbacteria bacterium RIFOXYD12_FULL_49_13]OGP44968.1 MAG: hypothetical protein A2324_19840 [Candidatus Raymondbacteria b